MVKATILFGRPGDEAAFQKYFEEVHLPAGARVPGLKRIETGKLDGCGSDAVSQGPYRPEA
jgi:uncharacterized protein (TIGR02118 family)